MPRQRKASALTAEVLEVLGEPSAAPEPGERPLDDPALRQGHEALGMATATISSRQRPVPATAAAVATPR